MYVELKKNFCPLIRARWWLLESFRPPGPKNDRFLLSRHDVRRVHEKFSSRPFERTIGCKTHFGLLSPKTFDSEFLHMLCVEFMKNFHLGFWNRLMVVRLILASCAQKRLIPSFLTWCTSSSWKILFSPIRASYWLLDSFWPPEPKNIWFLRSRHDVRWVHEKFLFSDSSELDGC